MSVFGFGEQKPDHYREMAKIAWENRDQLPFAWRILRDGVCDGCALGTSGLSDWTLEGTHLCMVRLELMRLNTAPALDPALLADAGRLSYDRMGRGVGSRRPSPARCRSWPRRVLPHVARHHQRGVLCRAKSGPISRDEPRRQF